MAGSDRRSDESDSESGNLVRLGPQDSLIGKLTIAGDLHVQGTIEGEVSATGDIQVDQSGTVRATLEGRNVSVRGQVEGNVTANGRLLLGGSGTVNGDVRVHRLSVEDGATLNGNVQMHAATPAAAATPEPEPEPEAAATTATAAESETHGYALPDTSSEPETFAEIQVEAQPEITYGSDPYSDHQS